MITIDKDANILKAKIIEAKDKLGIKAAETIADFYKLDKWDESHLKGCCPFHHENTPSFIWNKKDNAFKCFSCGRRVGILDVYMAEGLSYHEAVQKLFKETDTEYNTFDFKTNREDFFKNYNFPQEETNTDREQVEKYYAKRGISIDTLDYAEIKQDEHGNAVFEHRDQNSRLVGVKYRPARSLKPKEPKMWWQKGASTCPILYGVDKIDITQPLVICEGHSDRLAIIESGYKNCVSIPHGAEDLSWVEFNWEWLSNFDNIIIWSDNDAAGLKMRSESVIRLGEYRCRIVEPDSDIEDFVESYYKSLNVKKPIRKTDANNVLLACGKETVLKLLTNAKEVPIPDIKKLMEYQEFNINDAEVIETGIADLDSYVYGNIMGTLNIWTAPTGSGKSTILSNNCVLPAINADYPTFIYSGELTPPQLKNWTILQLAGRDHIVEWDNGDHLPKTYTVTNEAKAEIENKYNDLLYIYESYLIVTADKLIQKMEYLRTKYGVKNYVIDNLMCFDLDIQKHGNELNAQKNLIIQFLQFAVRYSCIVHLVAHTRKTDKFSPISEQDIFGSSAIGNLAHRIYSIKRVDKSKQDDPYDAYITVLKDRMLGVSKKTVGLHYDCASRRMYGDNDDVNKKYNWDVGNVKYKSVYFGGNGMLAREALDEREKEQFG